MKKQIPNAVTLLNLLFGVMACISALDGLLELAAIYLAIAAFMDLMDGFLARALKVSSPLGAQLDSLADMVSFGLAPALIARELILKYQFLHAGEIGTDFWSKVLPFIPLLMVAFSAVRLAIFNLDENQKVDFKGLPTPANAMFWISIPLSINHGHHSEHLAWLDVLIHPWTLALLSLFFGVLLVSRIPMLSLKIVSGDKVRLAWQLGLLFGAFFLVLWLRLQALPIIIVLYLLLSLLRNSLNRT